MQDIELTPQKYSSPVQLRGKEVNSPASKNLFQNINAYFQVIEFETDNDIVGFEWFSNIKKEKYLKYDGPIVLSRLNDNILNDNSQYAANQALCDVTVQLTEQVLTITRTYTKLIEVLGDVGGLMEVIFMIFKAVSSLITDLLYEKSMVNNLFEFDLDRKIVLIKNYKLKNKKESEKPIDKEQDISPNNDIQIYSLQKKLNDDLTIQTRNKLNNDEDNLKSNNKLTNDLLLLNKKPKIKKRI